MASLALYRFLAIFEGRKAGPQSVVGQLPGRVSVNAGTSPAADHLAKAIANNQTALMALIYFLLLSVPLILYTFRIADNNRLISWYWSVTQQQMFTVLAILTLVLAAASILAKRELNERYGATLLAAVAFAISIPFWNVPEVIIDNARYFAQAKYLELYGISYFFQEWGNSISAWTDLPLMPFLYGLAFQVFGEHRIIIQVINSALFAGSVLVTFELGRTLWGYQHGFFGAVLLLGFPYLYSQIPLMLVDIGTMFFVSAALLAAVLAVKHGSLGHIFTAVFCIALAMLTKYSAWLLLSVVPVALLAYPETDLNIRLKRLLQIAFGVLLIVGACCLWNYEVFVQQLAILFSYQWNALERWQESLLSTFFFQIHPIISIVALLAVFLAVKKRDAKFLIVSWMLLLLLLLEINRIRYLLVVFPMLALMAAYALVELPNIRMKRFIGYGVAFSSYIMALMVATGFLQTTSANNLQAAGKYLDASKVEAVEVMVLPQHNSVVNPQIALPTLDYYTKKKIIYKQGPIAMQAPANIHMSPVRFTWEYPVANYYLAAAENNTKRTVLALIYSNPGQLTSDVVHTVLQDYRLEKQLQISSGVFKFKTLVNIYVPI